MTSLETPMRTALIPPVPDAFGEQILRDAGEGSAYPHQDVAVRAGIDELQAHINAFVNSTHPDDAYARRLIAWRFSEYDEPFVTPKAVPILARNGDPLQWLGNAPYARMLGVLECNQERLRKLQQRIDRDASKFQEVIIHNVEQAIAYGAVPMAAKRLAERALRDTRFVAIDTFEAGFRHCDGYFRPNGQTIRPLTIGLTNGYRGGPDGLDNWRPHYLGTVAHEGWHVTMHKAGGRLRSIRNKKHVYGWWDESEAEHITQVGLHGQPDITDPRLREVPGDRYPSNRTLSHVIKTGGDLLIPQLLIGKASIEALDGSRGLKARTKLDQLLRRSFKDVIDVGNSDMNIVEFIGSELAAVPAAEQSQAIDAWRQKLQWVLGIDDPAEVVDTVA